jgi:hypothetical protein
MSEQKQEQEPAPNPDEGHPHGETLPDKSPTAGEAALRKGDVEVEGPKEGKGGHETHGAGAHDDPKR